MLLLSVVGVWSLRHTGVRVRPAGRPVLAALLRFLLPLLLVTGGYLLWIGAFAPGGAFQGGALLGGALVLMLLGRPGIRRRLRHRTRLLRAGLWAGLAVFVGVGLGVMLRWAGISRVSRPGRPAP